MSKICAVYKRTRQSYYQSVQAFSTKQINREQLRLLVLAERKVLSREGGRKLLRRIREKLKNLGIKIGRDKFFDFLREEGLLVKPKKRFTKTTNSLHRFYAYDNLIGNYVPIGAHQLWVSDITYLDTKEGFMYLALLTDAYSRKIVGYDISDSLELAGCVRAVDQAIKQLPKDYQLIHHSDRGIQYCSNIYTTKLKNKNIAISMAAKGNCYENAMAERVNGILKDEFYLDAKFGSKAKAIVATHQAIKLYNQVRLHMAIDYLTPEQKHQTLSTY